MTPTFPSYDTQLPFPPSIQYRGLFINDEEPALTTWWSKQHNSSHYPLDTEFYAHLFDMLLRLKANYLVSPAMKLVTPELANRALCREVACNVGLFNTATGQHFLY